MQTANDNLKTPGSDFLVRTHRLQTANFISTAKEGCVPKIHSKSQSPIHFVQPLVDISG